MTPFETEIYKQTRERTFKNRSLSQIQIEAALVIKNFLLIKYLRKGDQEREGRARLLMEFIAAKDRFYALRMKINPREPSTDILLSKFHHKLTGSVQKIDDGLNNMKDLQKKSQKIVKS